MRVVVVAALSSACWTGSAPAPEPAPPPARPVRAAPRLVVKLQRTPCMGTCPTFSVTIHGDGRILWEGTEHVAAIGSRTARAKPAEIDELVRTIDRVRFFERNEYGELPAKPNCVTTGSTTSCSFEASFAICSDTSHTILEITRDGHTHKIDYGHCNEREPLDDLEDAIGRIAHLDEWIGP